MTEVNFADECLKRIAKHRLVLDLGSGPPFSKGLTKFKSLFQNNYFSLDFSPEVCPHVVGDIHQLPFKDKSVDGVICNSVLEHIPEPQEAIKEIYRVLQSGGEVFGYIPFLHPYHGNSRYKDYYRFTRDVIEYIFRDFGSIEIIRTRKFFGVINLLLPFTPKESKVANFLDRYIIRERAVNFTSGFNVMARKD